MLGLISIRVLRVLGVVFHWIELCLVHWLVQQSGTAARVQHIFSPMEVLPTPSNRPIPEPSFVPTAFLRDGCLVLWRLTKLQTYLSDQILVLAANCAREGAKVLRFALVMQVKQTLNNPSNQGFLAKIGTASPSLALALRPAKRSLKHVAWIARTTCNMVSATPIHNIRRKRIGGILRKEPCTNLRRH